MFRILNSTVTAEFTLSASGPVLVNKKGGNELDPTLTDGTFLMGNTENGPAYVIPGSTIKGVIRSRFNYLKSDMDTKKLFGFIGNGNQKSKVSFHDAYADMKTVQTVTRYSTAINSIDQSAKKGTLNNMQVVEKGDFLAGFKAVNCSKKEIYVLLQILEEVNLGLVRFGGRKSRGFGCMRVTDFKLTAQGGFDENLSSKQEEVYDTLEEALKAYSERV